MVVLITRYLLLGIHITAPEFFKLQYRGLCSILAHVAVGLSCFPHQHGKKLQRNLCYNRNHEIGTRTMEIRGQSPFVLMAATSRLGLWAVGATTPEGPSICPMSEVSGRICFQYFFWILEPDLMLLESWALYLLYLDPKSMQNHGLLGHVQRLICVWAISLELLLVLGAQHRPP